MSGIRGSYFPVYPEHDCLPDPEIRAFITNFYKVSDRQDANELWISHFTSDAEVLMGNDGGKGVAEIRQLRSRMWTTVQERKHSVVKVFPGRFDGDGGCECMLFGDVKLLLKSGENATVPWAAHAVLKRDVEGGREEWKFGYYRVWLQR